MEMVKQDGSVSIRPSSMCGIGNDYLSLNGMLRPPCQENPALRHLHVLLVAAGHPKKQVPCGTRAGSHGKGQGE